MAKKNQNQENADNTEVEPVEVETQERPDAEPADDRGDASRAEDDPNRVVNNGEISDPGNSGGFGDTTNVTEGQADKPNG